MEDKKLRMWQDRLARNEGAYCAELAKMEERERLYNGTELLRRMVPGDETRKTVHVRNLVSEMIESQVNSTIPQPKVTPRRPEDHEKAKLIEDFLRSELDRLPMETLNDLSERTVPIQGGALYFVEWDQSRHTHHTTGALRISMLHPRQVIPQHGVFTSLEDMDYLILKLPQTRTFLRRRYGAALPSPDRPSFGPESGDAGAGDGALAGEEISEEALGDDLVTQYLAYFRNEEGGIGLFSWAEEEILEDVEDCQLRRERRCKACGTPVPDRTEKRCPDCGGKGFHELLLEEEELPIRDLPAGNLPVGNLPARGFPAGNLPAGDLPAGDLPVRGLPDVGPEGDDFPDWPDFEVPERIPSYRPRQYPLVLQKNVSVYGKFLGDGDIDKIRDQQNTTNRIEQKIIDKLLKSGSYLILPEQCDIPADPEDLKIIRPESPAAAGQIEVRDLQGNISQDMAYLEQVYQEARQTVGITESFQGRVDQTATSGKAKEVSAAQSAGRLESKRVMKNAAYSRLFELMFQYALSYMDEPRPVTARDAEGNLSYKSFSRLDFLERDEAGDWYWNDQFLFSCDSAAPLAANRDAMRQETRTNLEGGAFGDPARTESLILFWRNMEKLQYPGAAETRATLEARLAREQTAPSPDAALPPEDLGAPAHFRRANPGNFLKKTP